MKTNAPQCESLYQQRDVPPGSSARDQPRAVLLLLLPFLALTPLTLNVTPLTAADSPLGDTRTTLEKWVEARQTLSKNKTAWQNDKETLSSTIALYESEIDSLDKLSTTVRTNTQSVIQEFNGLTQERSFLVNASDQLKELTAGLEDQILLLTNALPQPLLITLDQPLRAIPSGTNETKASVPLRIGNVLGILNEIDKFNSMITVEPEVQTNPSGASIQVIKIYLGLAQAYFVNEEGTYAGVGVPSLSGWVWTTKNELAPTIARVRRQYEDMATPAFVALPVEIK